MKAQFTLRDVLYSSAVVCLAVGWLLERLELEQQITNLELRLQQLDGYIPPFSDAPTPPMFVMLSLICLCLIGLGAIAARAALRCRKSGKS